MDKGTPQTHPSDEWVALERLTQNIALRKRIAELEAEVARLKALLPPEDAELPTWQEAAIAWKARAEAAEAEVGRLRQALIDAVRPEMQYKLDEWAYKDRAEAAEAKLRAVGELPGKWRNNSTEVTIHGQRYPIAAHYTPRDCADELEALLKKEGGDG